MAGLAYAATIRYGLRWVLFVPVALLIAHLGPVSPVTADFIQADHVADSLVKWFLGDLLGVASVAPALLLLGFRAHEQEFEPGPGYGSEGEALAWNVALALSFLLMAWGGAYGSAYALGLS